MLSDWETRLAGASYFHKLLQPTFIIYSLFVRVFFFSRLTFTFHTRTQQILRDIIIFDVRVSDGSDGDRM